mgnify:CR=1 FL=1
MFAVGDAVYILDSGFKKSNTIRIIKRKFHSYENSQKTKIEVEDDDSYIFIHSWAVFPTIEDATRGAVAYLIYTLEFKKNINNDIDIHKLYTEFEHRHPELIVKYLEKVTVHI